MVAIWAIFEGVSRDKRRYLRDAALGWLRLPRRQPHPVNLKPAGGLVRAG
jgi:hypothetical protein